MTNLNGLIMLAGRALLAILFILAGFGKLQAYLGGTAAQQIGYMESAGVPGVLFPAVIALELLGGLALLLGLGARWAALALAIFTIAAAALYHNNFADQMQMIMFMKNLAITGGLLFVFANGPGKFAVRD